MLKDVDFASGTIEFDLELKGQGFPSINFRASKDTLNSEIFYLRHFGKPNPMLRTTMQYAAVMDGVGTPGMSPMTTKQHPRFMRGNGTI